MTDMKNAYSNLVAKPERKRPLGRRSRRWNDSIRMGLMEIVWEGVNWTQLDQDKKDQWRILLNTVVGLRVP
jgi:hypothetical protein